MFDFSKARLTPFDFAAIFANILSEWYYYASILLIIAAAIIALKFIKPRVKVTLKKTQRLSLISMLTALSIVANCFTVGADDIKFSLVILISYVSGYALGPSAAFTAGFLGDLVGCFIAPQGVYNPIIALASGLWGFFFGIAFHYIGGNAYIKTAIFGIVSFIVCALILNLTATYLMYIYPSKNYATVFAYIIVKYPLKLINFAANIAAFVAIMPALKKITSKFIEPNPLIRKNAIQVAKEANL